MAKLTLSIDAEVVEKAKRYAKSRRVSVSKLVERYLDLLSKSFQTPSDSPVLHSFRGALKKAKVRA
ncbi:MAG TPA: DUF6364 family protein [Bryobacteraceae bacterium]|nr:DUF6364 family protein [Bryobacteraceae bacterium]